MTAVRAIWLVARREIVERTRERSLLLSTAVLVVFVALPVALWPELGIGRERFSVAVAGAHAERVAHAAQRFAGLANRTITIRRVAGDAQLRRAVADGRVDVGLAADGAQISRRPLDGDLALALQRGSYAVSSGAPLPPAQAAGRDRRADERWPLRGVAFVALFLIYVQLTAYGNALATGLIEEKVSRISDLLLSTIRSRELLSGKIAGIGVVAAGQLLVMGAAATAVAVALGRLELDDAVLRAIVLGLVWFVAGYALYAGLYAIAGTLAAGYGDVQGVTAPLSIGLGVALIVSFACIVDPEGSLAVALSLLPLTSPLGSPARLILGEMSTAAAALSLALLLASAAAALAVAARVHARAALRLGPRLRLRDAWAQARR